MTRLPICGDVAERHRRQPVDADVDVARPLPGGPAIEVAAARRAAADEDRVAVLGEQRAHRLDARAAEEFDAELEDVAGLLVDHFLGQAEARDLRADDAAGLRVGCRTP